ncbi:MAG: outer membrane protein assembly factor BamB [Nevskia sp.]|nr:outer membrane protein assembly factor BamB [Nevskia sp.]
MNSARRCGHWALLLLAAAALALAGCGSKGKAREPAKLTRLEHVEVRPEREWSRRIGDGSDGYWSGLRIALASDALFAASIDGRVDAVNPQNGDLIWRVNTKARVISGPTLDGDQLYVGTLDGEVIALARADGKIRWRAQAPSEALAPPVGNGQVVVAKAVDGREYGLNAGSGERLWSFDRNEPNLTLRGLSAPLILGDRVYIGLDNGKLEALSLDDGQPIWEQTISVPTGRVEIERLTDIDADLLVGREGLYVVTYGGDLALIDPQSGDSRWHRSIKSYSGMALSGDRLYVTDDDGTVWSLDAATGAAVWKQPVLKYRRLSPPAVFDRYVVVGDYQGYLHWLSVEDGKLVGRVRLGGDPITTAPVVDHGLLYALDAGGRLAAYSARPAK